MRARAGVCVRARVRVCVCVVIVAVFAALADRLLTESFGYGADQKFRV